MAAGPDHAATLHEVEGALLAPKERRASQKGVRIAGVAMADGNPAPGVALATYRWRANLPKERADELAKSAEELPGRWLFGGLYRPHFGHVLTNALGRLWAVDIAGDIAGIVFLGDQAKSVNNNIYKDLAAALSLPERHHICCEPTRVERLVIAPDLFSEALECRPDPAFNAWISARRPQPTGQGAKLYVSRGSIAPDFGRILCEDVLEQNMASAGFEIFAPEQHSIKDQMARYRGAAEIVCMESSAIHLMALAVDPGTTVRLIKRRQTSPMTLVNHARAAFGPALSELDHIPKFWWRPERAEHKAMAELDFVGLRDALVALGAIGEDAAWQVPNGDAIAASRALGAPPDTQFLTSQEHRAYVRDKRKKRAEAKMSETLEAQSVDVPAINGMRYLRLIGQLHETLRPNWYLEIGTNKGRSLERAHCNFVAVDPDFILERPIKPAAAEQMFFFQQTSDAFFASGFCEQQGIEFDLAFLDGLHHYEFLLRDFMHAEKLMTPGGVILLHDCCPTSVEMTARQQTRGNWTGDVWKTLLILQRFRPDLDIMVTTARPTGLVIIRGLDPSNTVLDEAYEKITAEFDGVELGSFPGGISGYYGHIDLISPQSALEQIGEAPGARQDL